MIRLTFFATLLSLTFSSLGQPDPTKLAELKTAIEEKMDYHNVPAAGIAIVSKDGPIWIETLGIADRKKEIKADPNTLFRIGSVSKMFVALSILKLQEEGKLSLQDNVRDLVPEIEYENRWEETNPIRVVHLLEHTTGWDDFHLTEYASNDPKPLKLKEGLDYHPHSRKSRWIPGSRMAYCNSGPPVAAYIVEKITGMRFEDYVQESFFDPLGMKHTTYFKTDYYDEHGATLYQGNEPQEYWHILQRPSGSINSSAVEMAYFIRFLLNNGKVDSTQLVSEASIRRMELPHTTPAAQAGMKIGYGLHNYTTDYEGFVFHGHNGGVNGGLTDMGYLPEYSIGHIVMINCSSGNGLREITNLVRDFEIESLAKREPQPADTSAITKAAIADMEGYYMPINPRSQGPYFFTRLMEIQRLVDDGNGNIRLKGLMSNGGPEFQPISGTEFVNSKSGEVTLIAVEDPLVGPVLHQGTRVLKPILAFVANGQIVFLLVWLLTMIICGLVSFFWFILKSRKNHHKSEKQLRLFTMMASFIIFAFTIMLIIGANNAFDLLAEPGLYSISLFVLSILFAIAVLWSVYQAWKANKHMSRPAYWFYAALAVFHFLIMIYLSWYGVIGVRTWA